ncbi:MAG: type II secretion system protein [Oscillospiraceae bacterium]|nr:type II secretion system protein [Oscillospiraceae bacterium]
MRKLTNTTVQIISRSHETKSTNKQKKLKGFTLVEIIVVLVILAILAAAMIPALTGYIDKANQRTALSEARNVLMAAQTVSSEKYAKSGNVQTSIALDDTIEAEILKLADLDGSAGDITAMTTTKGKVTALTYITTKSYKVEYTSAGGFSEPAPYTPAT